MTHRLAAAITPLIVTSFVAALAACAPAPAQAPVSTPALPTPSVSATIEPEAQTPATSSTETTDDAPCTLPPVAVPTVPADTPDYAQLDETTGLHVTGSARAIDLASYRLEVTGKVDNPLSLTFDELRCMPRLSASPLLLCPGFFEDQAAWAGVPMAHVLDLAGVSDEANRIRIVGADGYEAAVSIEQARTTGGFLAYEWEGEPLPILHGFPVRAVFPTLEGNKWVKWIVKIEVY